MTIQTWNIDTAHSGIHFSVRHMVVAKVRGRFTDWQGTVELDPQRPEEASVHVAIQAASIDTGVSQRDDHLRSGDFFDVEQFPMLEYRSQRIERVSEERFRVHCELTLHGVTRPVTLDAELLGKGKDLSGNDRVAFSAKASLDRTEFGLGWNQVLEAGGVMVGTRIELELEVAANAPSAAKAA
jgi:polyisoprenoid-binding protein YceI